MFSGVKHLAISTSFTLLSLPSLVPWPVQIPRTSHTSGLARWLQPSSDVVWCFHSSLLALLINRQIRKSRSGAGCCTASGVLKCFILSGPDHRALLRVCWWNATLLRIICGQITTSQAVFAVLNQAEGCCFNECRQQRDMLCFPCLCAKRSHQAMGKR